MIWRAVTLAFVAIVAGAIGMWAADRSDPVTVESIRAVTPTVEAGGTVKVEMVVDRHRSCRLHVEHFLIDSDGNRKILPDLDFDALPGSLGHDHFTDTYSVPRDFVPGLACYRRVSAYRCNPLQMIWPVILDRGLEHRACFEVVPTH